MMAKLHRFRLPPEVHDWVREQAKADCVSMNAVVIGCIKRSMDAQAHDLAVLLQTTDRMMKILDQARRDLDR